jgi:hypothetical protein
MKRYIVTAEEPDARNQMAALSRDAAAAIGQDFVGVWRAGFGV